MIQSLLSRRVRQFQGGWGGVPRENDLQRFFPKLAKKRVSKIFFNNEFQFADLPGHRDQIGVALQQQDGW